MSSMSILVASWTHRKLELSVRLNHYERFVLTTRGNIRICCSQLGRFMTTSLWIKNQLQFLVKVSHGWSNRFIWNIGFFTRTIDSNVERFNVQHESIGLWCLPVNSSSIATIQSEWPYIIQQYPRDLILFSMARRWIHTLRIDISYW